MNPSGEPVVQATTCDDLAEADQAYCHYVHAAIDVPAAQVIDAPADSQAVAFLQLEVVHADALCQAPLADACVHVSTDAACLFVAPPAGAGDTGVSPGHSRSGLSASI